MFIRFVFLICCLAVSGLNAQYWRNWLPVKQGNYWGFIDEKGEVKEPCKYLEYLKEYNVIKLWDGKNLTVYEDTGKRIFPSGVNDFISLGTGFYAAYKEGKCYLSRKDGTPVFEEKYDYLLATKTTGLFEFCAKGKNGVIDTNGKVILEFPLIAFRSLKRGIFSVHRDNKFHVFNSSGVAIAEDTFKKIEVWDKGAEFVSGVYENNGGKIIDFEGNEVFRYNRELEIRYLGNGFLLCSDKQKKIKVYDLALKKMLPVSLTQGKSSEIASTFLYKNKGLWYFYFRGDTAPREGYKEIFSEPQWFRVKNTQDLIGFFDKNLNQITPFEFDNYWEISDSLIALSKKDSSYGIFKRSSLAKQTPLIYESFSVGDNYLKAYSQGNKMEMYDMDDQGNLSNKITYQNVRRFYISDRNEENEQLVLPPSPTFTMNVSSSSSVGVVASYKMEYARTKGKHRVSIIKCDSTGGICDTIQRRYYDSIFFRNFRYTIAEKTEEISWYDSIYRKQRSKKIKKQFLIDNENFVILDTAFDYISYQDVFTTTGNPEIMAIKMNAKYVLINKADYSFSEEYDYISSSEEGYRRRVKKGQWFESTRKSYLYEGNLRNEKYFIEGIWELVDEKGNVVEVKNLDNTKITYIFPVFMGTCIAQFSYSKVFVFDTEGKIIIPCQYNTISTSFIGGQYFFICGKDSVRNTILDREGNLTGTEKYNQIRTLGSVAELKNEHGKFIMNRFGNVSSLDEKAVLISFNKGIGLLKFQKKIYPVNDKLQPLTAEHYREMYPFAGNYTLARTEKGWGILDTGFTWVRPPLQKEKCGPVFTNSFLMGNYGKQKFVAFDGKPIVSPEKEMIPQKEIAPGVYHYAQGNKNVFADRHGKIIDEFKEAPQTEIVDNYLMYHLNPKTIRGVVLDTRTGKRHEIKELYGLGSIAQQQYDRDKLQNNIIDFYDYQKEIYQCKSYFYPVLLKLQLHPGSQNCALYKLGLVGKYDQRASAIVLPSGSQYINYGNNLQLCRFSGRPFTYSQIRGIRWIDSAGIMLMTHSGKMALTSEHGTWIIPPVVKTIRKMPGNNYGCEHPVYYHLYTLSGQKLEPEFTEYSVDSDIMALWKYNRFMYFQPARRNVIWKQ